MILKLVYRGKTEGEVFLFRARFFENLARLKARGFCPIMDSSVLSKLSYKEKTEGAAFC